jgi:SprT protein
VKTPHWQLVAYAQRLLDQIAAEFALKEPARIEWRLYRVAAGKAYFHEGVIGLSSRLLDTEEKVRDTLIHEYAHLLAVDRHGRVAANHGPLWQRAMRDLGAEPTRTHSYEVEPPRQSKAVTYRCEKCHREIIRKRCLPRGRLFVHAQCGGSLRLIAEARIMNIPPES